METLEGGAGEIFPLVGAKNVSTKVCRIAPDFFASMAIKEAFPIEALALHGNAINPDAGKVANCFDL